VVEVQGHTDWIGTENYNYGLGNRRARAVVYYLVYDEGIDPARVVNADKLAQGIIAGESYGETQPIASNETDSGRALNRRGQLVKLVADNRVLGQ
jgi:OOP family OmpA-OmpF porin